MQRTEQNIIKTLSNKRVLFIENDSCLDDSLEVFESILKSASIEYKILLDLESIDIDVICKLINEYDAIVYMTQWVYEISKFLKNYLLQLKQPKIVIESYINEPTWFYQIKEIPHQMYIFNGYNPENLKFYKLSSRPYWDYKNNFNK